MKDSPVAALTEYELRHLVAHLEAAARYEDLHRLLALETSAGRNAWFAARERRDQTAGYLDDIHCAWRLASAQAPLGSGWVGHGVRYALIIASIRSRAQSIPPPLVAMLVDKGIWLPARALAYARQIPDPRQQARMLVDLAAYLPESSLEEALAIVQESKHWEGALEGLAPYLPEPLLQEALEWLQVCEDGPWQGRVVAYLAPHLSRALVREALTMAQEFEDEGAKELALKGLAPHLPESHLQEALTVAYGLEDGFGLESTLGRLAPHLSEQLLREAMAMVSEFEDELGRAHALKGLAPHLPEPLLQTALGVVQKFASEWAKTHALVGLAPHLPEPLLGEALAAACKIEDEARQARVIESLAARLPVPLLREALATTQEVAVQRAREEGPVARRVRVKLLSRLAELGYPQEAFATGLRLRNDCAQEGVLEELSPHLPEPLVREALLLAREIEDEGSRASALGSLSHRLAELGFLEDALRAVQEIEGEPAQAWNLAKLLPYLPEPLLREALAMAGEFEDESAKAKALEVLAPHLPGPLLQEALAVVQEIVNPWSWEGKRRVALSVLEKLLSRLAELGYSEDALAAVKDAASDWPRAEALTGLAPHLPEPLLHEALVMVQKLEDERDQAHALQGLAPHLPEPLLQQALALAKRIERSGSLAEALAPLVRRLTELGFPEEALETVRRIEGKSTRRLALTGLAPHLSEILLREALALAQRLEDEGERDRALAKLAARMADLSHLEQALAAARELDDFGGRTETRAGLVSHLSRSQLREALSAARETRDAETQVWVLVRLAPHLPKAERAQVLLEALTVARETADEYSRARALIELLPHLPESLLQGALEVTHRIEGTERKDEALTWLVPRMAELGYPKDARTLVLDIASGRSRREALTKLAPHLPTKSLLQEAIALARKSSERSREYEEALADLLPQLPELSYPEEALAAAFEIETPQCLKEVLDGLASHLPMSILREALAMAQEVDDAETRMHAMLGLMPHLPEAERVEVVQDALQAFHETAHKEPQPDVPAELAPYFPEPLLREALALTQKIEYEWSRARALEPLILQLAALGYPEEALVAAREIPERSAEADTLAKLARYVPKVRRIPILEDALAVASSYKDDLDSAAALEGVIPQMAELGFPEEALAEARAFWWNEQGQASVLAKLAPFLSEPLLQEALAVACGMNSEVYRTKALAGLVPYVVRLPDVYLVPLWQETLMHLASRNRASILQDLCELVPLIDLLDGPEAIAETYRAIQDVGRWWP